MWKRKVNKHINVLSLNELCIHNNNNNDSDTLVAFLYSLFCIIHTGRLDHSPYSQRTILQHRQHPMHLNLNWWLCHSPIIHLLSNTAFFRSSIASLHFFFPTKTIVTPLTFGFAMEIIFLVFCFFRLEYSQNRRTLESILFIFFSHSLWRVRMDVCVCELPCGDRCAICNLFQYFFRFRRTFIYFGIENLLINTLSAAAIHAMNENTTHARTHNNSHI